MLHFLLHTYYIGRRFQNLTPEKYFFNNFLFFFLSFFVSLTGFNHICAKDKVILDGI